MAGSFDPRHAPDPAGQNRGQRRAADSALFTIHQRGGQDARTSHRADQKRCVDRSRWGGQDHTRRGVAASTPASPHGPDPSTTARALLDREPEEIQRGSSVSLAVASFDWKASDGERYRVNLIDTPGPSRLRSRGRRGPGRGRPRGARRQRRRRHSRSAADEAWRKCNDRGLPRMVFVTREDKHRANFEKVVAALGRTFGSGFAADRVAARRAGGVPWRRRRPDRAGARVRARRHATTSSRCPTTWPNTNTRSTTRSSRRSSRETTNMLERYLEGEEFTPIQLERTLAAEVLACTGSRSWSGRVRAVSASIVSPTTSASWARRRPIDRSP